MRFQPADFTIKSRYGVGVDWPISYEELAPWYDRAEAALGVAGQNDIDFGYPRQKAYPLPPIPMSYLDRIVANACDLVGLTLASLPQARNSRPYQNRPACCGSASCVPICPVQAKYDATVHTDMAEANGCRLIDQAVATRLAVANEGHISSVEYKHPDGTLRTAKAKIYVICAHAIETARLLLLSRTDKFENGLANSSGMVGRNLMTHIDLDTNALALEPVYPYRGPIMTSALLQGMDGPFRSEYAGTTTSPTSEGWMATAGPAYFAAKFVSQGLRGDALAKALDHHLSRQLVIGSSAEMLPSTENMVTLSEELMDGSGLPRPVIRFQMDGYSRQGLQRATQRHHKILKAIGVSLTEDSPPLPGTAVIAGTARMGDEKHQSVVDRDLCSHDHPNLFLVGSAVFPTVGIVPPTLTIAALALRAAEAIKHHLTLG